MSFAVTYGLAPEPWALGLLTWIGAALDRAVLRGMSLAFDAALVLPEADYPTLRAAGRPYLGPELRANPARFFAGLDDTRIAPPIVDSADSMPGGIKTRLRFASEYVPYHDAFDGDESCRANDTIWVDHWVHTDRPPTGTMIAIHGFTMGTPAIDARVMMVDRWFAQGLDVALVTLPFHGRRASAECRYSGELFASWHAGRLNEAVRQSVFDVHRVSRWLAARNRKPVGLFGVSLGGYVTALLAGLRSDLAFAIPVVPAVCLEDLPMRLLAISRGTARFAPPCTRAELRRAYRVHSPLTYPLRMPRERVLIVGGRGDAVTPVTHALRLWRHWDQPASVWFSGGHVAAFRRWRVAAAMEEHLQRLGFAAGTPAAARPLVAVPSSVAASRPVAAISPVAASPVRRPAVVVPFRRGRVHAA
jgi:pimeloyl-ACP methyl ester carboxylesterase